MPALLTMKYPAFVLLLVTAAIRVGQQTSDASEPESPTKAESPERAESPAKKGRPNVLFIAVDDLRPQLACYGRQQMQSPNIDRLAAAGVLFERAYCMVPTCGASRASLMTGLRPTPTRFVNYLTWAEKDAAGITTLNTHFIRHGYETISLGKIFHHPRDNAIGWSKPAWRPRVAKAYQLAANRALQQRRQREPGRRRRGPAFESADAPDEAYADGQVARQAIVELRRLKQENSPFFLAVGFFKPHLPFVCPRRYWDMYDPDEIRLPETYHRPKNAPDAALHTSGELRAYADIPKRGPVSDEVARQLIHGYYACVSFTDAQVGKVLDELDRLELADNTIVVLWGDHGWNLGEHTLWCKHCCFETSMQIPLIIRGPGVKNGGKTKALTETIDIYPTLCELAGLPIPEHTAGASLTPLLKNPASSWSGVAVGRYRQGDTLRTDHHRFTEFTTTRGKRVARMLYDHRADPQEDDNISEKPSQVDVAKRLARQLNEKKGRDE